jgi:hypothetical protein
VCSKHFSADCYEDGKLLADSYPTIFPSKPIAEPTAPRQNPLDAVRARQEAMDDAVQLHDMEDGMVQEPDLDIDTSVMCQTDPVECLCKKPQMMDQACQVSLPDITVRDIKGNDQMTRFFTGFFNFATFLVFLKLMVKHGSDRLGKSRLNYWGSDGLKQKNYHSGDKSKPGPSKMLDMATEFLMTMLWYRHGFVEEYLAYVFKVSVSTVSRTLTTWTQFIYEHSVDLVYYPSREEVLLNMPLHFINHINTYCVGDCTEFFMEKPSGLEAQCLTWSEYKHHNTIKNLIFVTPDGHVIYVSSSWGGKASDRHIVWKENALKDIPVGMAFMADKGFDVEDLAPDGVEVIMPPKVSSKSQMSDFEFFSTVDIAEPRIVVEMKMEQAKNFRILQIPFPIGRISTANQIIFNCFALTNLLPPLFVPACGPNQSVQLPIYKKTK